ncbi:MAG: hypothetical protein JXP34_28800 [Planctomycetes bacterium]|nr:hypothetical protein [Planctomycetota bacterium]
MSQRQEGPPPRKGGCGKAFACGCVVLIVLVAVGGGLAYMFRNKIFAGLGRWGLKNVVEQSSLAPEERTGLQAAAERVFTKMENGELKKEDYQRLKDSFEEQPISKVIGAAIFKAKYLAPSGLSPDEKARGVQEVDRFVRGVIEGKVSQQEIEKVMANFPMQEGVGGFPQLPDSIPDLNVRAVIEEAQKVAEAKGIPDEPYRVDLVEEANRWIDAALGEKK